MSKMDHLFVQAAMSQNLLNAEQAHFCISKSALECSRSATVVAVEEGFMNTQTVAEVYQSIPVNESPVKVFSLSEEMLSEDDWELRFTALVKEKGLVSDEVLEACQQEKKKLEKEGHYPQMGALLYTSGCLSREDLLRLYDELSSGGKEPKVLEEEFSYAEFSPPRIRKLGRKKPKRRKIEEAEMDAQISTEAEIMFGRIEEVLEKSYSSGTPSSEVIATEDVLDELDRIELELEREEQEAARQATRRISPSNELSTALEGMLSSDSGSNLDKLTETLQLLVKKLDEPLDSSRSTDEATVDSGEDLAEQMEEDLEESELHRLAKGYRQVKEAELKRVLKKGGVLEKCFIPELNMVDRKFSPKLSLENCIIGNLDLARSQFENHVSFKGSQIFYKAILRETCFHKDAIFKDCRFHNGADFTKTEVKGKASFNASAFLRFVSFNRSVFGKKAIFTRCYFAKGVKFAEVPFASGASFNDIFVDHRFYIEKCKFEAESTFSGARFSDIADFSRSTFAKEINFKGTNFARWASFKSVKFKDDVNFNTMQVAGDISFTWATFYGLINLSACCAERNVNFHHITLKDDAAFSFKDAYLGRLFIGQKRLIGRIQSHNQLDYRTARTEYGLLKNNFREINEYDKEDWAYLMEKRMARLALPLNGPKNVLKRFFGWLALDVACGYGTNPLKIFLTSLVTLLAFSLFYLSMSGEFVPSGDLAYPRQTFSGPSLSFLDSVQLSFRTFTNASVEGWVPYTDSWVNYIMMVESFIGFFVMTILVVTFSRKVIR